ncbi:MAG: sigma-70 family RNA polymerase sigma factor [Anaerolineae bacterium]|nr:sigma-70 family RNA polymerase sigma factor [Anaerolineae bacterium]
MTDYVALVVQAQHGSADEKHAAFNDLVARFQQMAFAQALRLLQDVHMAEDATQEAFLTAYLHLDRLHEPAAFPGWLRRIILTQADRQTRRRTPPLELLDEEVTADSDDVDGLVEARDLRARVWQALAALPEHERAVTEGFYLQGESQQELAERLQIPVTTVKKRLQYAREHLRSLVGGLNAAMDEVIAGVLPPPAAPLQKQPIYVYPRRRRDDGSSQS